MVAKMIVVIVILQQCQNKRLKTRTPMLKCDFSNVPKQLCWIHTSTWMFSCKFAAYFQGTCFKEHTVWILMWSPNISNNWLNEFQSDWILQFSGILIITKISNCWIVTSSTNVCCYWSNSLHHLGKIFQNKIQQTPGSNKNIRICLIDKTVICNL